MTPRLLLFALLFAGFAFGQNRVYELRTYTCNPGKMEALEIRFRQHAIAILKRHHIEAIGYWVPQDPELAKTTLIWIAVHPSRAAAEKNWAAFQADPEWQKAVAESEANGKIFSKPPESVFMDPTDFSKLK